MTLGGTETDGDGQNRAGRRFFDAKPAFSAGRSPAALRGDLVLYDCIIVWSIAPYDMSNSRWFARRRPVRPIY